MSKYLFLSAHADDSELSCGGTMQKLVKQGHEVTHIALSLCGNEKLLGEMVEAAKVLNVSKMWTKDHTVREFKLEIEGISNYLCQLNGDYDYIFTHSINDIHPDHRTVGEEALRIFKTGNLLTFIAPHNGNENPNYFTELEAEDIDIKMEAIACYKSQSHREYMLPRAINAQAVYNGQRCGKLFAEAFKVVRMVQ